MNAVENMSSSISSAWIDEAVDTGAGTIRITPSVTRDRTAAASSDHRTVHATSPTAMSRPQAHATTSSAAIDADIRSKSVASLPAT